MFVPTPIFEVDPISTAIWPERAAAKSRIEVLLGLQQRCRLDQVRTKEAGLRAVGDDLRRQQVDTIADYRLAPTRSLQFAGLVNALAKHARRALSTPAAEILLDQWDLAVFGNSGTVSFTCLSQPWLREAAKRWAIDDRSSPALADGRTGSNTSWPLCPASRTARVGEAPADPAGATAS